MAYDGLLALLSGPRPNNAASFVDPFANYDVAGWVARGMQYISCGNRMVANINGHAQEFTNIAQAAPIIYQPLGQAGTLTKKTDNYLAASATRPTIEWSDHTDLKALLSSNVLPATGEWWYFEAMTPLKATCQIMGQADSAKARIVIVNDQIRLGLASSGSGTYAIAATPDGANLINRSFGCIAGRRASDNKLVIEHHLAGAANWVQTVAGFAATSGAGGTGSALTVSSDVIIGANTVISGYSPYRRQGVHGLITGANFTPTDWTNLKQLIDMYSGL